MNNKFKIITTVWNGELYIKNCIDSVKNQTYDNWEMLIIDDVSTDKTSDIIKQTIANDSRIKCIRNKTNLGGLVNYLKYIPQLCNDDEDVLCFLDGDDALYCTDALEYLNDIYKSNKELWLTYGDFEIMGGTTRGVYQKLTDMDVLRHDHRNNLTHLKNLRYHLFRKIKDETFIDNRTGKVFDTVWDVIIMISAAQMANFNRIHQNNKILYHYNNSNQNSTVRSGNIKSGSGFDHLLETNYYFRKYYTTYEVLKDKNDYPQGNSGKVLKGSYI